jgi:hypothetical protein
METASCVDKKVNNVECTSTTESAGLQYYSERSLTSGLLWRIGFRSVSMDSSRKRKQRASLQGALHMFFQFCAAQRLTCHDPRNNRTCHRNAIKLKTRGQWFAGMYLYDHMCYEAHACAGLCKTRLRPCQNRIDSILDNCVHIKDWRPSHCYHQYQFFGLFPRLIASPLVI